MVGAGRRAMYDNMDTRMLLDTVEIGMLNDQDSNSCGATCKDYYYPIVQIPWTQTIVPASIGVLLHTEAPAARM